MEIVDFERLVREQDELEERFRREPFNYLVIDDFLKPEAADEILREFPAITPEWVDARGLHAQNKWTMPLVEDGAAGKFMREVNSPEFLEWLSAVTGIREILSDPEHQGAGYHQTTNGGFLNVHVDFNRHDKTNLDRRLNLLVYFNRGWSKDNGGYLELWDKENDRQIENVCPAFNRCVVFETNEVSFHGHPKPVKASPGGSRKSLSVYYYTDGRDDIDYVDNHSTLHINTESARGAVKIFVNGVRHAGRKLARRLSLRERRR